MPHETQTPNLTLIQGEIAEPPKNGAPLVETDENGLITVPDWVKPIQQPDLHIVGSDTEIIDGVPGMERTTDKTEADLAQAALSGGKYGNGKVSVENPGPQAIRQAASVPGSLIVQKTSATFIKHDAHSDGE